MVSEYINNFLIYYNNLSLYYVLCVFISILAIILSWIFHFNTTTVDSNLKENTGLDKKLELLENAKNKQMENILETYKKLKKQSIQKIQDSLTEDQLNQEKQAEREQLQAILDLLKQQEDKFQVASMEELEGQLKLYR